jgi:hypothetical protein
MIDKLRQPRVVAFGLALALGATGCGGKNTDESGSSSNTKNNPKVHVDNNVSLTFDDLGGRSSIIQVYAGPGEEPSDKEPTGTFNDGDTVNALCKTEGRTVHSDPSTGEVERTSDQWIRIEGSPGKEQYATAVYVEESQKLLGQLALCPK